jgi:hypothetical protein
MLCHWLSEYGNTRYMGLMVFSKHSRNTVNLSYQAAHIDKRATGLPDKRNPKRHGWRVWSKRAI